MLRFMEDLFSNVQLDPVASPIALLVIVFALRFIVGTVKTIIKVLLLIVILAAAYLFFYGGAVGG